MGMFTTGPGPDGDQDASQRHGWGRDFEALAQRLAGLHSAVGDLRPLLQRLVPTVVDTSTIQLGAGGTAELVYRVPVAAVAIYSFSAAILTVAAGPLAAAAPGPGPGSGLVRANGFAVINLRGYAISLYGGASGENVTVTAFGQPQWPTAT